ncbi:putative carboxypeptidase [Flavobacterium cauense R2A-7]|uniref:Muramoyltetrapeptide carboxypeptidase n=2 Tax=Flavobacterium TaxID=237 RepID=V6S5C1_9FLAO|nr:putative carboxypeptidase [Flavobacterium cauense R2A-7]TWI13100.1 muramoyltetrapeptide carboxypeptidase [Flavobacterium cauense R2A-7]
MKNVFFKILFAAILFIFSFEVYSQKRMKIPPYLKKGDTVALVCTARKFSPEEAQPAIDLLQSWGLQVKLGKTIGLDSCQLGGTDTERAADLQEMLDDDNIKAIWCARGGYGTVRIIDSLDFTKFKKHPKWIMGFSDVTVLHSHLNTLGIASLHSIMPFTVPKAPEEVKETLRKALFGENIEYKVPAKGYEIQGKAKGQLVGGNLSILYSLLGSKSSLNTKGKILFIEDLDEYLYHIDRMMQNLKRNGYFENLKGLIVGSMTDMHDNEIPFGQNEVGIIMEIAKKYHFPVCFYFPAGHQKDNRTLILGKEVQFEVNSEEVVLEFLK